MYIRELRVDGYGPLRDMSVSLEAAVTVVYGPNEAGKSSLLRFIRAMLYGIPTRKDPVERGEPVFGGRHGGGLSLLARDGRELAIERYADGSGGSGRKSAGGILVRDGNGLELPWTQQEWERRALGGVSERLFRQLFAVSLDELHELLTLQGDEIGSFLYHAGLAGGASLAEVRRRLASEVDKLYRPKGTVPEMNRLLASIKETEAAIRQGRSQVAQYREAVESMEQANAGLSALEAELPELARKAAGYRGALDARELWLRRQVLLEEERELALRLPDPSAPPLSEEATAEWRELLRRRDAAAERLAKAEASMRELRKERASLRWDADLLDRALELERLEAMREATAARLEERDSLSSELRMLEDALDTLRQRLSPGMPLDGLRAFVRVTAEREPLRRLQLAWGDANRTMERMETEAGRIERQRIAVRAEMDAATAGRNPTALRSDEGASEYDLPFGPFRSRNRETLQHAWNALEDEMRRWDRALLSGAPTQEEILVSRKRGTRASGGGGRAGGSAGTGGLPRYAASAASGIVALALVFAVVQGSESSTVAAVEWVGAALFAAAAFFTALAGKRGAASPSYPAEQAGEYRRRAEQRLAELLVDPGKAAGVLFDSRTEAGIGESSERAWMQLRQSVQNWLALIERTDRESARQEEWRRRLSELDREFEALHAETRRAAARLDELQAEWMEWLRRYGLPLSLSPDDLQELLGMAEQGQASLLRRDRTEERLTALDEAQAAFREAAVALFEVCPPPASMEADPVLSVSWLYRRSLEERSVRDEAARLDRTIASAEPELADARAALLVAEAATTSTVARSGAADEEEYERRLRIDESRRVLSRERREVELRMEAGKDPAAVSELQRLLVEHDEAALAWMVRDAEEKWKAAEASRTELLDRRGRLAQELERLREEAESEDRLAKLAEAEGKLERLAERYAVLTLADRLLQDTKAVFEEERQPEVLRLASRYFSRMTEGAYARITVPGDTPAIRVETPDRRVTDSAFLSRGTQEQLYLAMRFALAGAASREVPLPLLLDDLFVHFDERRLRQTVSVLEEIASDRQVILFTCHRHVADAVRQGLPSARIMEWGAQREDSRSRVPGHGPSGTASPD
ncbi:AAA family ATPase [Cohnella candidum]|uniref:YhaN AAA domain-containing protein n=1 Tax=Cohnella candidum TaxID=2674991 RepID=A0A3G3JZ20_9BACL|nr:AAA family ATPase [Cohnella candidum]AYQ73107.1 hypothetical protein EAV92_11345 [Cohnella candidum]